MKQTVYVLLRGGINPSTYVGTYATVEAAKKVRAEWQMEWPDMRFVIIEDEVRS